MVPIPTAFGMTLCEKVIVEEGTRRITLVNSFTKLPVSQFPSSPQALAVYAALIDGEGGGTITVVAHRPDTGDEVYTATRSIHFPDRLREMHVFLRISDMVFPIAGPYQLTLFVDGQWVAHRRLRVSSAES
jgi:hypothetical protein